VIEIVTGDARDVTSIMPIMEAAFDPAFGEAWTASQCLSALAMPGSRLVLASVGGAMSGFAISRWVVDSEELLMIGVVPSMQGRSVGRSMLDHIVASANAERRTQLFLEVRDGNSAQNFYSKYGFVPVGRRKQYYKAANGLTYDAITMALTI
jgi:[ribosomal protein S18]-alanine N-acetyltransferase